jgi:hypothetical protein
MKEGPKNVGLAEQFGYGRAARARTTSAWISFSGPNLPQGCVWAKKKAPAD